ncbi:MULTISPECIES: hypothetical protein [Pseudoalteromonas]|uniref:Uncharacterized protein n=2 Tax=Pseudoalteromonas TaxID=53246 RepID=A0A8I2KPI9_9GAMM|nr:MULTISPECIES: hypothetical protein [Pseudoalteromonas]ATD05635.1 hypothetical protein PPIS_a0310 [Pseudoalteromonas piscicida]KID34308.1 hypothetical protein QT15_18060 [Pseudoalteromonas flavipulchra NCIMB 2033 = ATCC BAA-314]MBD0784595.1 hypothetical protein [Pseudoalteromonas flavipulchra]MBE0372072.1 hypothetical protein [Pseudoalteromonas flavipulchra NCIMB 2033 = ATCC BAA-314]MCO7201680.1 hypothetical protein [Pseudoalteromonas sp. OANN1]
MLEQIVMRKDELGGERSQFDIDCELRAYLKKTDWYVIRELETGETIPADVKELRKLAREAIITPFN